MRSPEGMHGLPCGRGVCCDLPSTIPDGAKAEKAEVKFVNDCLLSWGGSFVSQFSQSVSSAATLRSPEGIGIPYIGNDKKLTD